PASIGKLLVSSFKALIITSIVLAEITILGGLLLSYTLDLPAGGMIVLFGAALFFIALFTNKYLRLK
ncbi:MAG: metal ABC transporter permease, partial [Patescibacteria group bacterium]